MRTVRVALAQLNPMVGDLAGNVDKIAEAYASAAGEGVDLVVFSELVVCGYPPEDLLLKPGFIASAMEATTKLAVLTNGGPVAVIGFPEADHDLHNAAAVCAHGTIAGIYRKQLLPNYAVFDEERYFVPGHDSGPLYEIAGVKVGVTVCEDIWAPTGPVNRQAAGGAELAVNINGSPFHRGKAAARERMLATRAADASIPLVYCNQVGGQDELVFDGCSVVLDETGRVLARGRSFEEDLLVVEVAVPEPYRQRLLETRATESAPPLPVICLGSPPASRRRGPARIEPLPSAPGEVWDAIVLGVRDYVAKNGFDDVVIGLSGGVDSALVTAVAVAALGAGHVHTVAMPSRYSSEGSVDDAAVLAANLGVDHRVVAIEPGHRAFLEMLAPSFGDRPADLTEENVQARVRGVLLMALSNKFGWLVLTTGNKSESAVGFSTLYGDTAGGFAPIKDVLKLGVYELCRYFNEISGTEVIPGSVLTKPPSAELRPDQTDEQSLPPYEVLDPIVEAYVEDDRTAQELIDAGHDPDVVRRVTRLIDVAEYKRRQSPPGVKISQKAFGRDRRLPLTNGFRR